MKRIIFVSLVLCCLGCSTFSSQDTSPLNSGSEGENVATPPVEAKPKSQEKKQAGKASVYADKFQGKKTASGDLFDQRQLTAASKTFPLGSKVKVTNKKTGQSAEVTVNDRGPYVKGRAIDLSKAAASEIGMGTDGVADVHIEKLPEQK